MTLQNGHDVTFERQEIKHQYGCFLQHLAEGRAPVVTEGFEHGGPCLSQQSAAQVGAAKFQGMFKLTIDDGLPH